MQCSNCHRSMIEKQSQDFFEDRSPMILKAWRCHHCGTMMEEIQILPDRGKKLSRRFQYVVRPWKSFVKASPSVAC